jgi:hypothetical protein
MTEPTRPSIDIYKRVTDTIMATATLILGLSLTVAVYTYLDQERTGRLQRTLSIMTAPIGEGPPGSCPKPAEAKSITQEFPDRYQGQIKTPLPAEEAESFLDITHHPEKNPGLCNRYDTARKHLNRLQTFAFVYVNELTDRKILAASVCREMARSNRYFKTLIDAFKSEFGEGHTWQVIPQAVTALEARYGEECKNLKFTPSGLINESWFIPTNLITASGFFWT